MFFEQSCSSICFLKFKNNFGDFPCSNLFPIILIVLDYNILLIVFGHGKRLTVITCNITLMSYRRITDNFEIGFK